MSRKKTTIIIISIVAFLIMAFGFLLYTTVVNKPASQKRAQSDTRDVLESFIGGEFQGDEFVITYTENPNITFNIYVTGRVFSVGKDNALRWLEKQGLDLENTSYTCRASKYVKFTEEEINSCNHVLK